MHGFYAQPINHTYFCNYIAYFDYVPQLFVLLSIVWGGTWGGIPDADNSKDGTAIIC